MAQKDPVRELAISMARFKDAAEAHDKKNQEKAQKAAENTKQTENKDVKEFIKLSHQMKQPDYGKSFAQKSKEYITENPGKVILGTAAAVTVIGGAVWLYNKLEATIQAVQYANELGMMDDAMNTPDAQIAKYAFIGLAVIGSVIGLNYAINALAKDNAKKAMVEQQKKEHLLKQQQDKENQKRADAFAEALHGKTQEKQKQKPPYYNIDTKTGKVYEPGAKDPSFTINKDGQVFDMKGNFYCDLNQPNGPKNGPKQP